MCIVLDKSSFLVIVSCIPSKTCEKQKYPYVIKKEKKVSTYSIH